jgi:hypothetical protein
MSRSIHYSVKRPTQLKASADWSYHEIATHHLVPFTHPQEIADILLALD